MGFGGSDNYSVFHRSSESLDKLEKALTDSSLVVGFNIKFDLHWLRRYGLQISGKVWDCQYAHFLLTAQKEAYPSLQGVCEHYGIKGKIAHIEDMYWSKGIDTPDIPEKEMLAYLEQDLRATEEVYQRQLKELEANPKLLNLFKLHMDDLLVLQDMEYNGLLLDTEGSKKRAQEVKDEIVSIEKQLSSRYPHVAINWDSGDQLSAYLFGGPIATERREVVGIYATGAKIGQPRFRVHHDVVNLPRLVDPIEGSELAKADKEKGTGPWSTAEDVLTQLRGVQEVKPLLRRAELTKLLDYLEGWPELIAEKDWRPNEVHGQFNQVRARTGRLSSSSPNQQNLPDEMLKYVITRYPLPF